MLLTSILTVAFNVQPGRASGTIYINADGSVDPPTTSISTVDKTTYKFTADIYDQIVVYKDSIVIDGDGFNLQGPDSGIGMLVCAHASAKTDNVTIKNTNIKGWSLAIYLSSSSYDTVSDNNITTHGEGIGVFYSSNNVFSDNNISGYNDTEHSGIYINADSSYNMISGNNITDEYYAMVFVVWTFQHNTISGNSISGNSFGIVFFGQVALSYSIPSYNIVSDNNIAGSEIGIWLYNCSGYTVSGNFIASNHYGVRLDNCIGNAVYHNDLVNNVWQARSYYLQYYLINAWDDGYPSGGNYWSDYATRYPSAAEIDNSGLWNTPYVIASNNTDNYPLMSPWGSPPTYGVTINAHCNTEGIDVAFPITEDGSATVYTTPNTFNGLTGTHTFTVPSADTSGHPFAQWSTCQTSTTITVSSGGTFTAYYGQDPVTLEVIQNPIVNPTGPQFQVGLQSNIGNLLAVTTNLTITSDQALIYTVTQSDFLNAYSTKDLTFAVSKSIVNNTLLEANFTVTYAHNGLNRVETQSILAIASDGTGFPTSLSGALVMVDDPRANILTLDNVNWDPKWQSCVYTSNNYKLAIFGFDSDLSAHKYMEYSPINLNAMPAGVRNDLDKIFQSAQLTGVQFAHDSISFVVTSENGVKIPPKFIPLPMDDWETLGKGWNVLDAASLIYDASQVFDDIWKNPIPASDSEYQQRIFGVLSVGFTAACIGVAAGMLFTGPLALVVGGACVAYSGYKFYQSITPGMSSFSVKPVTDESISIAIEQGYSSPSAQLILAPDSPQSSVSLYDNSNSNQGVNQVMVPLVREGSNNDYIAGLALDETYVPATTSHIQLFPVDNIDSQLFTVEYPNDHEVMLKTINPGGSTCVSLQEPAHDLSLSIQAGGEYVGVAPNGSIHVGIPGAWFSGQTWPIKEILIPDNCSAFDAVVSGSEAQLPTEQFSLTISTTSATGQIVKMGSFVSSINQRETLDYAVSLTNASGFQVMSVSPSKNVVGQGYQLPVNVMLMNMGNQSETFNVTAYANATILGSQNVTLATDNSTTFQFIWSTTGFAKGNYTVWAYAEPVQGETYTADNNFTGGWVKVTIVGDVNGDGKVNLIDVFSVALAYGSYPGHPTWNPNYDINNDGKINLIDYFTAALNYGKTDP